MLFNFCWTKFENWNKCVFLDSPRHFWNFISGGTLTPKTLRSYSLATGGWLWTDCSWTLIWLSTWQQFAQKYFTETQLQLITSVTEFNLVITDLDMVLNNQLSFGPQVTCNFLIVLLSDASATHCPTISDKGPFDITGASIHILSDYCTADWNGVHSD